jgi:hypothetical protein
MLFSRLYYIFLLQQAFKLAIVLKRPIEAENGCRLATDIVSYIYLSDPEGCPNSPVKSFLYVDMYESFRALELRWSGLSCCILTLRKIDKLYTNYRVYQKPANL